MKLALSTQEGVVGEARVFTGKKGIIYVNPREVLRAAGIPKGSIQAIIENAIRDDAITLDDVKTATEIELGDNQARGRYKQYISYGALGRLLKGSSHPGVRSIRGTELVGARRDSPDPALDVAVDAAIPEVPATLKVAKARDLFLARYDSAAGIMVSLTNYEDDNITRVTLEYDARGMMPRTSEIERAFGVSTGAFYAIMREYYIEGILIEGPHIKFVGSGQGTMRLTPLGFRALIRFRRAKRAIGYFEARMQPI